MAGVRALLGVESSVGRADQITWRVTVARWLTKLYGWARWHGGLPSYMVGKGGTVTDQIIWLGTVGTMTRWHSGTVAQWTRWATVGHCG